MLLCNYAFFRVLLYWFYFSAFLIIISVNRFIRLENCYYNNSLKHNQLIYLNWRTFTRSQLVSSLSQHNKSALTDHAAQENHMINWSKAMVIDREPERFSRCIKEAVHIRKEGQHAMNRDDGSCQLNSVMSTSYDRFLDTSFCRVKNRKNWVPASSDEGLW